MVLWALDAAIEQRPEIPMDVRHAVDRAKRLCRERPGSRAAVFALQYALRQVQALGIKCDARF